MNRIQALLLLLALATKAVDSVAFELPDLDGKLVSLAEFSEDYVVLNYWATWCKPCVHEMPALDAFNANQEDVAVIGLTYDGADAETVASFVVQHAVSYPILMVDLFAAPESLGEPRALPTTFVLGPDREIAKTFIGPLTIAELESALVTMRAEAE